MNSKKNYVLWFYFYSDFKLFVNFSILEFNFSQLNELIEFPKLRLK